MARASDPAATATTATPAPGAGAEAAAYGWLPPTFRSLRHREYRLLWFGTLFSSAAMWVQQVTVSWLTYQLTSSAFLLGAVNGTRSVPLLVLAPFGGVAADRFDRQRVLVTTQLWLMTTAAVFATVVLTGHVRAWHLFVFTAATGIGWAFNMPVRQSIVPNVVPREDLLNATALNSAGFNSTRILGPSLAGILIATVGAGENFVLQAGAYLCVALLVLRMRLPPIPRAAGRSVRGSLAEGAAFVWRHPTLRTQMVLALVPVVIAFPYISLMPIFAKDVLARGPGGFGLLMSAAGVGAVASTLALATLAHVERKGLVLLGAVFTMGAALMLFALSESFVVSLLLLVLVGAAQMAYQTTNQTVLQLSVPDEMRGRVMGIYMLNQGLLPLGSLFAGALADVTSAPVAVLAMGSAVCVLALAFAWRAPSLRAL